MKKAEHLPALCGLPVRPPTLRRLSFFAADPADGRKKAHQAQLLRSTSQTRFNHGWPQRCSAATEAMFRLRRAGRGELEREGVRGNRRKEFLTIRGWRPRLRRMRFLTNVGAVFPDEGHPLLLC